MNIPSELLEVVERIKTDRRLWEKVRVADSGGIEIRFCCNSASVRRVLTSEIPGGMTMVAMPEPGHFRKPQTGKQGLEMPRELAEIAEKCDTEGLRKRVTAYHREKFDLAFLCAGGGLKTDWIEEKP